MLLRLKRRGVGPDTGDGTTSLRVATGQRWEIAFPDRARTSVLELPASCVSANGFPSAALGAFVERIAERLQAVPETGLGIFAHVDPAGGAADEKRQSDALARVVHLVLVNDEDGFEALASERGWGVAEHQAMLRALGCNPAAIDGDAADLTSVAARFFQEEWNLGWHHPDGPDALLEVAGELDAATCQALRRAYLLTLAGQFSAEQFHGPGWSGCASFVPRGFAEHAAVPPTSARVALALYGHERPERFPCVAGSPAACRVDDLETTRCRFYRHVIEEPMGPLPEPVFFDFEWMPLPSGKVNLSVLTSLPDGARPVFEVYRRVTDYDGRVRVGRAGGGEGPRGELVALVPGIVRLGVAVALFEPPVDWSPFDVADWWVDLEADDDSGPPPEERTGDTAGGFRPPVFRVRSEGQIADSRAPGRRLDRIPVDDARDGALAITTDASVLQVWMRDTRAWPGERRRADEHIHVVGWASESTAYRRSEVWG